MMFDHKSKKIDENGEGMTEGMKAFREALDVIIVAADKEKESRMRIDGNSKAVIIQKGYALGLRQAKTILEKTIPSMKKGKPTGPRCPKCRQVAIGEDTLRPHWDVLNDKVLMKCSLCDYGWEDLHV